jgi:hypothetical protein
MRAASIPALDSHRAYLSMPSAGVAGTTPFQRPVGARGRRSCSWYTEHAVLHHNSHTVAQLASYSTRTAQRRTIIRSRPSYIPACLQRQKTVMNYEHMAVAKFQELSPNPAPVRHTNYSGDRWGHLLLSAMPGKLALALLASHLRATPFAGGAGGAGCFCVYFVLYCTSGRRPRSRCVPLLALALAVVAGRRRGKERALSFSRAVGLRV